MQIFLHEKTTPWELVSCALVCILAQVWTVLRSTSIDWEEIIYSTRPPSTTSTTVPPSTPTTTTTTKVTTMTPFFLERTHFCTTNLRIW